MSSSTVVQTVEKMLRNEQRESELFLELMVKTDDPLVKHLFRWVMLDSLMHQEIMGVVASHLSAEVPTVQGKIAGTHSQFVELAREEGEVQKTAIQLGKRLTDKRARLLLHLLALDERKHGEILQHVLTSYEEIYRRKDPEANSKL